MARGFESKSVESQQEAAADRGSAKSSIVLEDPALRTARATLTLARTRVQADLKKASAPAHRSMLEQAIADLDQKIAALVKP